MDETKTPILVGSGQITQREPDVERALSPIDLTAAPACKRASRAPRLLVSPYEFSRLSAGAR